MTRRAFFEIHWVFINIFINKDEKIVIFDKNLCKIPGANLKKKLDMSFFEIFPKYLT